MEINREGWFMKLRIKHWKWFNFINLRATIHHERCFKSDSSLLFLILFLLSNQSMQFRRNGGEIPASILFRVIEFHRWTPSNSLHRHHHLSSHKIRADFFLLIFHYKLPEWGGNVSFLHSPFSSLGLCFIEGIVRGCRLFSGTSHIDYWGSYALIKSNNNHPPSIERCNLIYYFICGSWLRLNEPLYCVKTTKTY